MKTRPRLLLIDDDLAAMCYYVKALEEAGYDVTQIPSVTEAISFMRDYSQAVDGVILDMMLPKGHCDFAGLDNEELHGGKAVLAYLQTVHPGIPVLILTNISHGELLGDFHSSDSIQIAHKFEHSPFEVVEKVKALVGWISSAGDVEKPKHR
jgi:CheY-like chemotaxis protein